MPSTHSINAIGKISLKLPKPKEVNILLALGANEQGLRFDTENDEFETALGDGKNSRKRLLCKLQKTRLIYLQNAETGNYKLTRRGQLVLEGILLIKETLSKKRGV